MNNTIRNQIVLFFLFFIIAHSNGQSATGDSDKAYALSNSSSFQLSITFRLKTPMTIKSDSLVIKGNLNSLSRKVVSLMEGPDQNGFYTKTLIFPDTMRGKVLEYFYQHAWNKRDFRHNLKLDSSQTVSDWWGCLDGPAGNVRPNQLLTVVNSNSPEEKAELATPFVGITTAGKPDNSLFSIHKTGVSTLPMKNAVNAFLSSLSPEQKAICTFPIESDEWRRWSNIDIGLYKRTGLCLEAISQPQKDLAFDMLKESLSAQGIKKAKDIMQMEAHLAYLTNQFQVYGADKYWLTFMGTPSDTEPWGWQLDGHHLIINCFILGDQMVMTPLFMGSEPTHIETGEHKGLRTFEKEEASGFAFYASLTSEQKGKALIWNKKDHDFNQTEGFHDNEILPQTGLWATELSKSQKKALLQLIKLYVSNMRDGHAKIKMKEVRAHLSETTFTWIQGDLVNGPFYYRIHSPVILIEFDHHGPIALRDPSKPRPGPSKAHIHTVVRTPNGNDYGKDLLKEHLEKHHKH